MLDAGIQALGIFPDDDEIDAGIAGRNMGKVLNRTEVGVELELLAQGNVDTGKASADGRGHRPLQSDPGAFDGLDQFLGNIFVVLGERLGPYLKDFPIELHPGGFQNAHRGLRDFGADAVAGNECDFVSHIDRACVVAGALARWLVHSEVKSCGRVRPRPH